MKKFFGHLTTVMKHRRLVREHCFKLGLYYQGLTHDLSKFSPTEFWVGVKYFQGTMSPNSAERAANGGYSYSWLHHKGRNKHHLEYWMDYSASEKDGGMYTALEMPPKYFAEMICDRLAASKTYRGAKYKDSDSYDYFMMMRSHYLIHPKTDALLEKVLRMVKEKGEDYAFAYIRKVILGKK